MKILILQIQRVWNVKAKLIPVITGATGTISEVLGLHLNNITRKREIKELQTTALLDTAQIHSLQFNVVDNGDDDDDNNNNNNNNNSP